ncbi:helicase-related protein [Agromyces larvae]|uniref:Helicase C-terminal domain-containing protein n=1 Tax=Agromyces larvae TaxID=2929802 RepID=A0ABY4C243_9MICO|nr:helicase-related protein [Agromyces larvae]UOE44038.1 hypothetical protein MTO99_18075 [Agromyces larvae]
MPASDSRVRSGGRRHRPLRAGGASRPPRRAHGIRRLLAAGIAARTDVAVLRLHGRLAPAERKAARSCLAELEASGEPFILIAIDKIAGEGIDLPVLDTLFLAVPVSFKGRVIQQVGRVTRGDEGGMPAVVHDFRDLNVPLLGRMHSRRRRVLGKEGFGVRSERAPIVDLPSE